VGAGSKIESSVISSCIIQEKAALKNVVLRNSMVGNHASVQGKTYDLSLGDYNDIQIN
jgi:glucose-1-phosphate thymidylyltransferase